MDWRFNTIWFEQLEQDKIYQYDFKKNVVETENKNFNNAEYAIIWHLKEKLKAFDNLPEHKRLLYLELNQANIKNFDGVEQFKNLKRLELHHCLKLENDFGLSRIKDSLEFLHINTSKKFKFSNELPELKKLKVLCLNDCGSIDNLNFLNSFPNLIDFRFVNTNILDGNLRPILEHPTIRSTGFLDKRHYNFKSEHLKSALESKSGDANKTIVRKGDYLSYRYD